MSDEIIYTDAIELAERIRLREVSPVEVAQAHLDRIEAVNPALNALIAFPDGVMDRAREAEAAVLRGDNWGPLHGVPFTVKDCVDTAGVRTTRGSKALRGPCPVRRRHRGAKAEGRRRYLHRQVQHARVRPVVGDRQPGLRAHREPVDGRPHPRRLQRRRGLGYRRRHVALGHRQRCGRVHPGTGQLLRHCRAEGDPRPHPLDRPLARGPAAVHARGTLGPLGAGRRLGFQPDGRARRSRPLCYPGPGTRRFGDSPARRAAGGLVPEGPFAPVDREVQNTVAAAAAALGELGCLVEPVGLEEWEDWPAQQISARIFSAEGSRYLGPIIEGRQELLALSMQRRLSIPLPAFDEYLEAMEQVELLRAGLAALFTRFDVLLCPSGPVAAHPHDTRRHEIGEETAPPRHALTCTVPFDLTGSPALSVPFGSSREGLPIGVQLVGRHFEETTVLRAGAALEELYRPNRQRPPLG